MNIAVILRAVQDPAGFTVNRRAQKIFVNQPQHVLDPAGRNALEAALTLAAPEDTVTALACGGAEAEDALRQALAAGASRAVLVAEPSLQTAEAGVLARVIRAALDHTGGCGLLLLGAEVIDADLAQVCPRLAATLDWPFVESAWQLRRASNGALQAVVREPDGAVWVEANLPAVVSIARDSNQPRLAPAGRIIAIYDDRDAVERVSPAELGLDEAALAASVEHRGEAFPPERVLGQPAEGTLEELAEQAAAVLRRAR